MRASPTAPVGTYWHSTGHEGMAMDTAPISASKAVAPSVARTPRARRPRPRAAGSAGTGFARLISHTTRITLHLEFSHMDVASPTPSRTRRGPAA